jgi:hypothetical protein
LEVAAEGFVPGSNVLLTLATPEGGETKLATTAADSNTEVAETVTVPASVAKGNYTLQAAGATCPDGTAGTLGADVRVTDVRGGLGTQASLARTGLQVLPWAVAAAVALIVGWILVRAGRRRRQSEV